MAATSYLRILQFTEALIAAAEAHHALAPATKRLIETRCPGLGPYLRRMSVGFADGVCEALEDEKR
jgi:hypothetical protein